MKHTFQRGSGGMPPQKHLPNHHPEIESGGFGRLLTAPKFPLLVCKTTDIFSSLRQYYYDIIFLNSGGETLLLKREILRTANFI